MQKTLITTLLCGVLVLATGTAPAAAGRLADAEVVRTEHGLVQGTVTPDHRIFQGIPYAAPPVGDLRWRAPQPVRPWPGVREAKAPGSMCSQTYSYPPGTPLRFAGSEDCLYLNLHVPRTPAARLPVMVFLHGGNAGSGGGYDPRPITGPGRVIVVTINYRLGALGYLRHASLHDPYAGNFALADQQSALRWVRRNIAAFGGDSGNVTLWGESYGGFNVCAQLASPPARGLFDKAIVQSAPCGNDLVSREEADRRGVRAVEQLGCAGSGDVAACLRALPARQVAALPNGVSFRHDIADALPWLPTAGTPVLPRQPLDAVQSGQTAAVPLLHGGTRHEMTSAVAELLNVAQDPLTTDEYRQIVRDFFKDRSDVVLANYPSSRFPAPSVALATLLSDEGRMVGACSQLSYNDAHARLAPVYAYQFAEESERVVGDLPLRAHHGIDIPYFFDSYLPGAPPPARDPGLTEALVSFWTGFARSGRPGAGWTRYKMGNGLSLSSENTAPIRIDRAHRCDFWRG